MKYIYSLFLCFAFLLTQNLIAQDCHGSLKPYYLNGNNIKASFFPRGNKFYSGQSGDFLVPFPSEKKLSTIFASSPWVGGFDDAGNLKFAGETYPNLTSFDFRVGPLTSIGTPFDSCEKFDTAWNVYREDILNHSLDYQIDYIVDDTIASIFGWPARGNKYFSRFNGFERPEDTNQGLADFKDLNSNDKYEPDKGEYPVIRYNFREYVPDQIMWMVFNDAGDHASNTEPLRFEFQLTAYAFYCQDNDIILNNTIFNSYKIINRAVTSADSVFFGMWTDYDLGCHSDDFIGSDSIRSTEYVYNDLNGDGSPGFDCSLDVSTYGANPPVQSMSYLSHPLHSVINAESGTEILSNYNLLNGRWPDGSIMRASGDGHILSGAETKFIFHGDPRDSAQWAAVNVYDEGSDQKIVSSVSLGRFDPGELKRVDLAYSYHYDPQFDHLGQIGVMQNHMDYLLSLKIDLDADCIRFPHCIDGDCVWPGDFNHNGIADHYDLLHWGVMNNYSGSERNGLVSWRGHYADDWSSSTPSGLNYKHGDGDGNGFVDFHDLIYNEDHFYFTSPGYLSQSNYTVGPEIILSAEKIDSAGRIKNLKISTGQQINNVLGLAFELELDTSIFRLMNLHFGWPTDTNAVMYSGKYNETNSSLNSQQLYAAVQTNNQAVMLPANTTILRSLFHNSIRLKPGLTLDDIPDTVKIRLKNLIALDAEGNDLHVGANELFLLKSEITSTAQPEEDKIYIYPNPANDIVQITGAPDFDLIDPQGRVLQIFINNSGEINVSEYSPGVYFIRVADNNTLYKLIIQ